MKKNSAVRKRDRKKNNRGLTLVELIVTIAIISIFSGVVLTTVRFSSNVFRTTSTNAKNQMSAQETLEQLENLVIDANRSVYYTGSQFSVCSLSTVDSKTYYVCDIVTFESQKLTYSRAKIEVQESEDETTTTTVQTPDARIGGGTQLAASLMGVQAVSATVFQDGNTDSLGSSGGVLSDAGNSEGEVSDGEEVSSDTDNAASDFSNGQAEASEIVPVGDAETEWEVQDQLLAQNVTNFVVDTTRVESEQIITFTVTMETNSKEITTKNSVNLRNKIQVAQYSEIINEQSDEETATIQIRAGYDVTMTVGDTQTLKSKYTGDIDLDTILFEITEGKELVTINQKSGNLELQANNAGTVTVRLTAKTASGKSAGSDVAVITINPLPTTTTTTESTTESTTAASTESSTESTTESSTTTTTVAEPEIRIIASKDSALPGDVVEFYAEISGGDSNTTYKVDWSCEGYTLYDSDGTEISSPIGRGSGYDNRILVQAASGTNIVMTAAISGEKDKTATATVTVTVSDLIITVEPATFQLKAGNKGSFSAKVSYRENANSDATDLTSKYENNVTWQYRSRADESSEWTEWTSIGQSGASISTDFGGTSIITAKKYFEVKASLKDDNKLIDEGSSSGYVDVKDTRTIVLYETPGTEFNLNPVDVNGEEDSGIEETIAAAVYYGNGGSASFDDYQKADGLTISFDKDKDAVTCKISDDISNIAYIEVTLTRKNYNYVYVIIPSSPNVYPYSDKKGTEYGVPTQFVPAPGTLTALRRLGEGVVLADEDSGKYYSYKYTDSSNEFYIRESSSRITGTKAFEGLFLNSRVGTWFMKYNVDYYIWKNNGWYQYKSTSNYEMEKYWIGHVWVLEWTYFWYNLG